MKKQITYTMTVVLAVVAVSFAAPDKEAIKAKETAAWQAWKDKKDIRGVYAEGFSNMQKHLEDMQKWDMKSFTISDYQSFSDEPDVIVTTYVVKVDGTFDGQDASGTFNSGSVWKKEKDAWMIIFHTNAKQETATSPAASPSP